MAAKSDGNFIYTTQNLRRVHPPAKEVLKDLSLCCFFGAKIGGIGGNGGGGGGATTDAGVSGGSGGHGSAGGPAGQGAGAAYR